MDTEQYIIKANASTIVVIKGLATTAGSSLTTFASSGSTQPITFAKTMLSKQTRDITPASLMETGEKSLSKSMILAKHITAIDIPIISETKTSFKSTLNTSLNLKSSTAIARITVTDA